MRAFGKLVRTTALAVRMYFTMSSPGFGGGSVIWR